MENRWLVVSGETAENFEFDFRLIGQDLDILGLEAFRARLTGYASQRRASNCLRTHRRDHSVAVPRDRLPSDSPVAYEDH
jgi:hypothetical protein